MIKHHIKISLRHLFGQKTFSLINILGLAVGIGASMIVYFYLTHEFAFDEFHSKKDRIYRLDRMEKTSGERIHSAVTGGLFGPALKEEFPEIIDATRFLPWFSSVVLSNENRHHVSDLVCFADDRFFQIFDFKLKRGSPSDFLSRPGTIAISEEIANHLFPDSDPVGSSITGPNGQSFEITAVLDDVPKNSHLNFEALISWSSTEPGTGSLNFDWMNRWFTQVAYTFLEVSGDANLDQLEGELNSFLQENLPEESEKFDLMLEPLAEIYLASSDVQHIRKISTGNGRYVKILILVAIFLLAAGAINYINLSTSQTSERQVDIAIRKVFGAAKRSLVIQVMTETTIIVMAALMISVLLVEFSFPWWNNLLEVNLSWDMVPLTSLSIFLLAMMMIMTLISGVYPALMFANQKFSEAKVNRAASRVHGKTVRTALSVVQYALAILLISFSVLVYYQSRFVRNKDLGFEKERLMVLELQDGIEDHYEPFVNDLAQNPGIISFTNSQTVPGLGTMTTYASTRSDHQGQIEASFWRGDHRFLSTFGISLAEGRDFDPNLRTDSVSSVIINESMVRALGLQDPVGKKIYFGRESEANIIGVVRDFNYESLYSSVSPMFMYIGQREGNMTLKLAEHDLPETISYVQSVWEKYEEKYPFEYEFIDEKMASMYDKEDLLLKAISIFTLLSIWIACLGLYGLTRFLVQRLRKEIGIRKVLGAKIGDILRLISGQLGWILLMAAVISIPLASVLMSKWLNSFAYHVNPSWWIFGISILAITVVALLTMGYQSLRAAAANPADSLRYE